MKKSSFILSICLVLVLSVTAYAMVNVPCTEEIIYSRDKGKPSIVTDTFISAHEGAGKITIKNGVLGGKPVTSAKVWCNGVLVCGPSDFNSNVTELIMNVTLKKGENTLEVLVDEPRGGKMSLEVSHEVDADAGGYVGPAGGIIESEIGTIEVPENVVDNLTLFTMSLALNTPQLPNGMIPLSSSIDIDCSQPELNAPVIVKIPLIESVNENDLILAAQNNENDSNWAIKPIVGINSGESSVSFITEHFSIFIIVNSTPYTVPDEQYTSFDAQVDSFHEGFVNPGQCYGMANYSLWYYLNNHEPSLKCSWNLLNTTAVVS